MKLIFATASALGYVNGAGRVPTVMIEGADGEPLIINESDFDKKIHKMWEGDLPEPPAAEPPAAEPPAAEPPAVEQLLVLKSGTGKAARFFISDSMGAKIEGDQATALGIDATGYATEAEATTALGAIQSKA